MMGFWEFVDSLDLIFHKKNAMRVEDISVLHGKRIVCDAKKLFPIFCSSSYHFNEKFGSLFNFSEIIKENKWDL